MPWAITFSGVTVVHILHSIYSSAIPPDQSNTQDVPFWCFRPVYLGTRLLCRAPALTRETFSLYTEKRTTDTPKLRSSFNSVWFAFPLTLIVLLLASSSDCQVDCRWKSTCSIILSHICEFGLDWKAPGTNLQWTRYIADVAYNNWVDSTNVTVLFRNFVSHPPYQVSSITPICCEKWVDATHPVSHMYYTVLYLL